MSAAELSPKARVLLADMPPYYGDDPNALAAVDVAARELQRVEDYLLRLRERAFPSTADDEDRMLGLWEEMANLPVEPLNQTVGQRRAVLLAWLQQRKSGAASAWAASITRIIGTQWTQREYPAPMAPSPYQLAVDHPYDPQSADPEISYTGGQVEEFMAATSPAHLERLATYDEGFLVGFSRVGIEHL